MTDRCILDSKEARRQCTQGPQPFSLQSTCLIGYVWAWVAWAHTHHLDGLGPHTSPGWPGHTHHHDYLGTHTAPWWSGYTHHQDVLSTHTHLLDGLDTHTSPWWPGHTHITMMAWLHTSPGSLSTHTSPGWPGHTDITRMTWAHGLGWRHRKQNVNTGTFSVQKVLWILQKDFYVTESDSFHCMEPKYFWITCLQEDKRKIKPSRAQLLPYKKLTHEQNMYPSLIFWLFYFCFCSGPST